MGSSLLAVALCTVVLTLPVVLNRGPIIYFDSASYLHHAGRAVEMLMDRFGPPTVGDAAVASSAPAPSGDDDPIPAGRSIYYSFFAWVGAETLGLRAVVAVQALTLAALIVLTVRTVWPGAPPARRTAVSLALAGLLAFLTSAGLFVSLITPDMWAGLMILALALLLAAGSDLTRRARLGLGAVMALAVLFHTSHLLLLAAMTGLLALAMLRRRWRQAVRPWQLGVAGGALACGLVGQVAFSTVVTRVTGDPPLALPYLTAHLVDLGPGTRFAQESCPDSGFAICPYADRLPADWIHFLFSEDERTGVFHAAPPPVRRAMLEEQARFALATLAAEPLATAGGLLGDGIRQLWWVSVTNTPLTVEDEVYVTAYFAPDVVETTRASAIWTRDWVPSAMTRLVQVGTALAAAGLIFLALARRLPRRGPLAALLLLCVMGLVLNAFICGVLASPYGRFQARVAWLLPFLLVLALLEARSPRSETAKGATHRLA